MRWQRLPLSPLVFRRALSSVPTRSAFVAVERVRRHRGAASASFRRVEYLEDGSPAVSSDATRHVVSDSELHERSWTLLARAPDTRAGSRWRWLVRDAIATFLPQGYPDSVASGYTRYVGWQGVSYVASSASGVLSTQALLMAVGLGASTAIPVAAAMNWVLKDGLGQLGSILVASAVSRRFDEDSKRWRLYAALALDGSILLEVLTPLVPALFLPLASLANIGKNISWLSASASRAGIHNALARADNLADITAKAGSQTIAASLVGTTLGVSLSPVLGGDTLLTLCAFAALSAVHLASNWVAVQAVSIDTLNVHRAELVLRTYLASRRVPSPEEVAPLELTTRRGSVFSVPLHPGATLPSVAPTPALARRQWHGFASRDRAFVGVLAAPQTRRGPLAVGVVPVAGASAEQRLASFVHACLLRWRLEQDSSGPGARHEELVFETAAQCADVLPTLSRALRDCGWRTDAVFLDDWEVQVQVQGEDECTPSAPQRHSTA